jgi:hypothetical protein
MAEGCPPLDNMLKGCENPGGGAVLGAALGTDSDQPEKIASRLLKFQAIIFMAYLMN